METWSRGRLGEDLEEVNAKRGTAHGHRVTPARWVRTLRMRKPLKPGVVGGASWPTPAAIHQERHEGTDVPRGMPATEEGKPLKAKAHGRYRHETRPERIGAEESVRRSKKPGDAA